jgi:hypothetical protein
VKLGVVVARIERNEIRAHGDVRRGFSIAGLLRDFRRYCTLQ